MSDRSKVGATLLLGWLSIPTVQLAALGTAATEDALAESAVSPLGRLGEPVVLLLLGLLLATVGIILARRSSEKRVALKSSRDV